MVEVYKGLTWEVQGLQQQTNFFVLPLCRVVIWYWAMRWLKTLGPILWNFHTLTMQFRVDEVDVSLNGLKGGAILMASKKQLAKMNHFTSKGLYSLVLADQPPLQLGERSSTQDLDPIAQWELQTLISQYASIFDTFTRLPPKHSHDHQISLLDDS